MRHPCQGPGPCPRCESAATLLPGGRLLLFGGATLASPRRLLSDVYCLDLGASPPTWQQLQPRQAGGDSGGTGGMVAVAGHAGAAMGELAVFVGGCRRLDRTEPEALVQVCAVGYGAFWWSQAWWLCC